MGPWEALFYCFTLIWAALITLVAGALAVALCADLLARRLRPPVWLVARRQGRKLVRELEQQTWGPQ